MLKPRKWMAVLLLSLSLMVGYIPTAYSQDAPAPTAAAALAEAAPTTASAPAPEGQGKEAGFFANNIELIVSILGMVFTALLGLGVFGKYTEKLEKIKESKTWDIAKTAALDTYHTYVQAIKKGKQDGRLSAEEAAEARSLTIAKMKELAKSEGVKLIKSQLPALSELAVNFLKKKAVEAKARS